MYFINVIMGKRTRRNMDTESGAGPSVAHDTSSGSDLPGMSREMSAAAAERDPRTREPLDLSMYEELSQRYQQLAERFVVVQEQCTSLARRVGQANSEEAQIAGPHVEYISHRESVPPFRAEIPASQPLKRNQEVESWIRHVENATYPHNDAALIRAAKSSCRGTADVVVNSPIFDGINSWEDFKSKLRARFRGTCSSTDFFRHLNDYKLAPGQAPADFFVMIETTVYQGVRDYPRAMGAPDEVMRRIFLQGLPIWLREAIVLHDEGPLPQLVDATQKFWSLRTSGGSVEGPPTVIDSSVRESNAGTPRDSVRYRGDSPPRRRYPYTNMQTNTRDSRERRVLPDVRCFKCNANGHISRNCPFSQAHGRQPFPSSREPRQTGTRGSNSRDASGGARE